MKATDKDEGLNGKIKYSITAGVKKEHFAIDEDTGMIKTAAKLDYETKTSYQLTVKGNLCLVEIDHWLIQSLQSEHLKLYVTEI